MDHAVDIDQKNTSRRHFLGAAGLAVGAAVLGTAQRALAVGKQDGDGSIRTFVDEMYQAIWFDKGGWIDSDRLRSVMHPQGQFAWAENGGFRMVYIDEFLKLFGDGFKADGIYSLHERSLGMKVFSFGDVAQVFDTYEATFNDGAFVARGVNAYQLVKLAGNWRCISLAWHEESADMKLPSGGF